MTELTTDRLILRPPHMTDAPCIQQLINYPEIIRNTLTIPYPYPDGGAEAFIQSVQENHEKNPAFIFAIVHKAENQLIGVIGLHIKPFESAEVGYWLGIPYWGQGYMTEALQALIKFGFETQKLNRIYGTYFVFNPASRRVMEKCDMVYEGTLREYTRKDDVYIDVGICAILRSDYG